MKKKQVDGRKATAITSRMLKRGSAANVAAYLKLMGRGAKVLRLTVKTSKGSRLSFEW